MGLWIVIWLLAAWLLWRLWGRALVGSPRAPGTAPPGRPAAPEADPWTVLGVARGASAAEIRAAYQRAVSDYHPDQVAHLGEDLRRLAEQRTKAITAAYARLRGRR